ncbi:ribonuclease H protein [Trifolium medium]|uniref:Ribonuclease H protein n=1 Tax=Trifolium medium TaxID=97028 RepID=A0A392MIN5_9FABA|nr:ribonuclease H protein [Trifolium medium]
MVNWREIECWLPASYLNKLKAIVPAHASHGPDQCVLPEADREFSVAYAYNALCEFKTEASDNHWKQVWKLQVQERVRCFIWLLVHDRLATRKRINNMHMGDPYCYHCGDVIETALHVLRDCPLAVRVWYNMVDTKYWEIFFNVNMQQWVDINLRMCFGKEDVKQWSAAYWATTCHYLWFLRNKMTHGSDNVLPTRPWDEIHMRCQLYAQLVSKDVMKQQVNKCLADIRWKVPKEGWISINTDGAAKGGTCARCGGVLRGEHGEWISGFSKNLEVCSAYVAELWGVFEGLKIARARGFRKIELQVDSQVVVNTLATDRSGSSDGWTLVHNIKRLLELDWEVSILHEANSVADALANLACLSDGDMVVYESCPPQVRNCFHADLF